MNWNQMKVIGSLNKSFESMNNQLFLSFLKRNNIDFEKIIYVNGDGGDGGVESYVILSDGSEIGVQSKFFDGVISNSQISQICNSVKTAMVQHPKINQYHIFISRDLGNKRKGTKISEYDKVKAALGQFSDIKIVLWGESEILNELTRKENLALYNFWFEDQVFTLDVFEEKIKKRNETWLKEKYIPELHMAGKISNDLLHFCGLDMSEEIVFKIKNVKERLNKLFIIFEYIRRSDSLNDLFMDNYKFADFGNMINNINGLVLEYEKCIKHNQCLKIEKDYVDQLTGFKYYYIKVNEKKYSFDLSVFCDEIEHFSSSYQDLINYIVYTNIILSKVLELVGDVGVGKTNVVGYLSNKLIELGLFPVTINFASVDVTKSIPRIVYETLGLNYHGDNESLNVLNNISNIFSNNFFVDCINKHNIVILFDGCDEIGDYEVIAQKEKDALYISSIYDNIKFIFVGRPYCFNKTIIDGISRIEMSSSGENGLLNLMDKYFKYYNITFENSLWALDYIKTPFVLKMFCDINREKYIENLNDENSSMYSLFMQKLTSDNEKLKKILGTSRPSLLQNYIKNIYEIFNLNIHDRDELITRLRQNSFDDYNNDNILNFLSTYGYISRRKKMLDYDYGIESYDYFPGVKSYFDFVDAKIAYEKGELPNYIGSRRLLSILILENEKKLISKKYNSNDLLKYDIYSLVHCTNKTAKLFYDIIIDKIKKSPNFFRFYFNNILLAVLNDKKNPIGIKLFNDAMVSFLTPINRDLFWAIPEIIEYKNKIRKSALEYVKCGKINYIYNLDLKFDSRYDIVSVTCILFWQLCLLDNKIIQKSHNYLVEIANKYPKSFIEALCSIKNINDEQMHEYILDIIKSALINTTDIDFVNSINEYINTRLSSLLTTSNMSIRYLLTAISTIINKNFKINTFIIEKFKLENSYEIDYNSFDGKDPTMGCKYFSYDLSRYVLVEPVLRNIRMDEKAFDKFLAKYVLKIQPNPKISNYIIAYARKLLLNCGWKDDIMRSSHDDNVLEIGIDDSIQNLHWPASHGSKSDFMTITEKYSWIARKQLMSIFAEYFNHDSDNYYRYDSFNGILTEARNINFLKNSDFSFEKYIITSIDELGDVNTFLKGIPTIDFEKWLIRDDEIICSQNYHQNIYEKDVSIDLFINMFYSSKRFDTLSQIIKKKKFLFRPEDFLSYYDVYCYISPVQIINEDIKDSQYNEDVFRAVCANVAYKNFDTEVTEIVPSSFIRENIGINRYNRGVYYSEFEEVMKYYKLQDNNFITYDTLCCRTKVLDDKIDKKFKKYWIVNAIFSSSNMHSELTKSNKKFYTKLYLVKQNKDGFKYELLLDELY